MTTVLVFDTEEDIAGVVAAAELISKWYKDISDDLHIELLNKLSREECIMLSEVINLAYAWAAGLTKDVSMTTQQYTLWNKLYQFFLKWENTEPYL